MGQVLKPTLTATVTATAAWALVTYLMKGQVEWPSTLVFVVLFALVFGSVYGLWPRRRA